MAMLRMHRDGVICLPPPQKGNGNGRHRPRATAASDPPLLWRPSGDWSSLEFRQVKRRPDSALWNELIQRYHYLKYKPLAGAQIRYLVYSGPDLLASPSVIRRTPNPPFVCKDGDPPFRRVAALGFCSPVLSIFFTICRRGRSADMLRSGTLRLTRICACAATSGRRPSQLDQASLAPEGGYPHRTQRTCP